MTEFSLKVLIILSMGHMTVDIYQGALPAILPFLKEKLGLSYTLTGVIIMISNFTSSILQPLFGFLSDRKKKPILLYLGLLSAGAGFSFLFIPSDYTAVLVLVIISGLGVAAYHPEGYKTAYFFTGEKRATGMSIFSVGGNLGFSLGPILAIYTIHYVGYTLFPVIIIPSILCTMLFLNYKEKFSLSSKGYTESKKIEGRPTLQAYSALLLITAFVVVRSWTQLGLLTYIPFYYINHLKGDPLYAGRLVFVFLLCGAAGTLIGAPLADRWGHRRFLRISMFLATVTLPLFFLPFIQHTYLIFFILGLQGMLLVSSFSVTIVMAQRLIPNRLGVVSGILTGLAIGTGGIGVTLLGAVADRFGVLAAMESIMLLPFLGFIFSILLRYRDR
ncbi:MAG: MFS transporter [Syntrophorhabdaceae bacterium]|nr:MFS transporter [Syntrophorhabdaceae bacterium]